MSESEHLFARADGTSLPRRPHGSGDAWVEGPDGRRFWGTFGAAGLLVHHPDAGVLLQHRVEWSHFGGTWGLPGGARHEGESAVDGAIREAEEEAGVPRELLRLRFLSVLDLSWWSYSTVVVESEEPFTPVIGDAESLELRWVGLDEIEGLPLHPGFAASWPSLREALMRRPVLLIAPDAEPLGAGIAEQGVPGSLLGLAQDRWWPEVRPYEGMPSRSSETDVFVVTADPDLKQSLESEGIRALDPQEFEA